MFDFFRNNIKFLMGFLMLLIIPAFVLFGVEGYSNLRENRDVVAKVGRIDITRQEWDLAHRNEMDRLVASMPGIDRSLLDNESSRMATLERLINDRVLALAAQDGLFLATDQRLARELTQDPNIAALRRADGTLDVERYQQLLRAQGMTPEMFEASVRADLARRQVIEGLTASAFLTPAVADQALQAFFERREVQVAHFRPADFRAAVQVTDADVQAFYDQNPQLFQSPEQVDVEYLVLDLDAVAARLQLSEADLRAYHEQNSANLALQEQRRARHILLTVEPGASAEARAAVKAEAEALLAELRQHPERFPELARARSQDPGSAAQGGDLDFFSRGAMVKPFEDAAFALERNAISDVVETEFGYHIIQVTDIRRPAPEPFEVARPRLERELRQQQAQRRFAEAAEDFSNLVYEQADSLAPAAEALGLTVRRANGVLRTGPLDAGRDAALANSRVLEAVFAPDSLRTKRNTEAVEIGASRLVSARVLEHRPARLQPLDDVKAEVRERLLQQRAQEAAREEAQKQLAAWRDGAQPRLQAPVVVSRIDDQGLPGPALGAALSASAGPSTAAWTSADLGADGVMVIRVNRVLEREAPDAVRASLERNQLAELWAQAEAQAYLQALRARYKVQVLAKRQQAS
ncbi:SurA N-terminal domain-containing protein [Tepidicella xavieri]|uniref:Periplasmic chaperone PpiD n=1 Tax=Tepidicella xavieri TaxID=360241 RepID=A0A4R6UFJ8_9BURK|nr:SurA N-terminal domain-containing protein [Tepidicella xavieri]TDQ44726.1 peptidyl-prolyl cis-trans isomerase D [Tepidicella xavieri]